MNKQTADYITLKPLADRFKEVLESISDDEIRGIIKQSLKDRIDEQLRGIEIPLEEIVSEWFYDEMNVEWVINTLKDSIENRLLCRKG